LEVTNKMTRLYDVVIVGSGPAGLACLSAIQEPYSIDTLTEAQRLRASKECGARKKYRVAIVDPSPSWLSQWGKKFEILDIQTLRSPAMAHPDLFDQNSLLAFAIANGREKELIESGCGEITSLLPLGQPQFGLWKLPSKKLFHDFCNSLIDNLSHDYFCDTAIDVTKQTSSKVFEIKLKSKKVLKTKALILATGVIGYPAVPLGLKSATNIIQWTELDSYLEQDQHQLEQKSRKVLVVGGGLTAVQAALKCEKLGMKTVLCSRRPLTERHFDLPLDWFDWRTSTKCMADFYHQALETRLKILRESRGGGSVPRMYMNDIKEAISSRNLEYIVGDPKHINNEDNGPNLISFGNIVVNDFDVIVLACGIQVDCTRSELYKNLLRRWPLEVSGGYPNLSDDLEWIPGIFVVGGMGSLHIGPGAANLAGMRRAALIVANALDCREWLHECNVLKNPYDVLRFYEETESESESD
jgi:hypothetical protein